MESCRREISLLTFLRSHMNIFKFFEYHIKLLRCYSPQFLKVVKDLRNRATEIDNTKPIVIFDFVSLEIDNVMARYLYHLVADFDALGYQLVFADRMVFLATTERKRHKKYCFELPFALVKPDTKDMDCDVLVTDREQHGYSVKGQVFHVNYELIRSKEYRGTAVDLPFFVHPSTQKNGLIHNMNLDMSAYRSMRIFFAGNNSYPNYDKPVLQNKFKVMSRHKVLKTLKESLGERYREPKTYDALVTSSEEKHALTVYTSQADRIPNHQWMNTLQQADFFLCAPGVEMPLCHNLIESMAAGTIPILQYSNYVSPVLENMKNCLTFDSEESLKVVVERALSMDEEEVLRLRKNARAYYDAYCKPGMFAERILGVGESPLTIMMNAYRVPLEEPCMPLSKVSE